MPYPFKPNAETITISGNGVPICLAVFKYRAVA